MIQSCIKLSLSTTNMRTYTNTDQNLRLLEKWRLEETPERRVVQIFQREVVYHDLDSQSQSRDSPSPKTPNSQKPRKPPRASYLWAEGLSHTLDSVGVVVWIPGIFVSIAHVPFVTNVAIGDPKATAKWTVENVLRPLFGIASSKFPREKLNVKREIRVILTHGYGDFSRHLKASVSDVSKNFDFRVLIETVDVPRDAECFGGLYVVYQPACPNLLTVFATVRRGIRYIRDRVDANGEENLWPSAFAYGERDSSPHPSGYSSYDVDMVATIGTNLLALWKKAGLEPLRYLFIDVDSLKDPKTLQDLRKEYAEKMMNDTISDPRVVVKSTRD